MEHTCFQSELLSVLNIDEVIESCMFEITLDHFNYSILDGVLYKLFNEELNQITPQEMDIPFIMDIILHTSKYEKEL